MGEKQNLSFGPLEFSLPDRDDECCVEIDDRDEACRRWMKRTEVQALADWINDVWGITAKEVSNG